MINKPENLLHNRLVDMVTQHDRAIRELKSALQPIGADILSVESIPPSSTLTAGPVAIAAGTSVTFAATVTPSNSQLTLWNFLFTLYVDGFTFNDRFSAGSNLSAAQRNLTLMNWIDWVESNDVTNVRIYKIRVTNNDSSTHNYYLDFKAYLPTQSGSLAS